MASVIQSIASSASESSSSNNIDGIICLSLFEKVQRLHDWFDSVRADTRFTSTLAEAGAAYIESNHGVALDHGQVEGLFGTVVDQTLEVGRALELGLQLLEQLAKDLGGSLQ